MPSKSYAWSLKFPLHMASIIHNDFGKCVNKADFDKKYVRSVGDMRPPCDPVYVHLPAVLQQQM